MRIDCDELYVYPISGSQQGVSPVLWSFGPGEKTGFGRYWFRLPNRRGHCFGRTGLEIIEKTMIKF
jgi:hypothetical protein